jgi:hypothetical protein
MAGHFTVIQNSMTVTALPFKSQMYILVNNINTNLRNNPINHENRGVCQNDESMYAELRMISIWP